MGKRLARRVMSGVSCVVILSATMWGVSASTPIAHAATASSVTGVSPSTGTWRGQTKVSVQGQNLAGATEVTFNGADGVIVSDSATSIAVVDPAVQSDPDQTIPVDVVVYFGDGSSTPVTVADQFTYLPDGGEFPQTITGTASGAFTFDNGPAAPPPAETTWQANYTLTYDSHCDDELELRTDAACYDVTSFTGKGKQQCYTDDGSFPIDFSIVDGTTGAGARIQLDSSLGTYHLYFDIFNPSAATPRVDCQGTTQNPVVHMFHDPLGGDVPDRNQPGSDVYTPGQGLMTMARDSDEGDGIRAPGWSGQATFSLGYATIVPPAAPTAPAAHPRDGSALVSWTAPSSSGTSPIIGYIVTPSSAGGTFSPQVFNSTATSEVVSDLSNGDAYTMTVQALTASGPGPRSVATNAVTPSTEVLTPGVGSVTEGDSGTVTLNVPITLSNPNTVPVTVNYATLAPTGSGLATSGTDFVPTSGTVTFAPGQITKNVPITVNGDTIHEPPLLFGEWILLQFSHPTNAVLDTSFFGIGVGVIVDDDPVPTIEPGSAGVVEGNSGTKTLNVPVTLSNPSALPVTVSYSTLASSGAGLATAGTDFVPTSGTVTFAPGQTTQTVPITIIGDTIPEPPLLFGEWILVQFSNPVNATLDTKTFFGLGIGVIVDDD